MSEPLPPLAALRAFEAAARLRSLTAAASELNVTHAAIAQQVRKLEAWFGTPLLYRSGRGVAPTQEGLELASGLSDGFSTIRDAVGRLSASEATRPLNITLTPTFASRWLMPRLEHFRASTPGVEIMINPSAEVVDMSRGGFDAGFRFGRGDWPGLEAERVIDSEIFLSASPALLERRPIEQPSDLLKVTWIQELGSDEMHFWIGALGVDTSDYTNIVSVPGSLAIEAVLRGQGVGITTSAFVKDDIEAGRLVRLFPAGHQGSYCYFLIYRPGYQRPPLKKFIQWVRREIRLSEEETTT